MTVQYLRALHSADFPRGREKGESASTALKLRNHSAPLCGKMSAKSFFADTSFGGTKALIHSCHYKNKYPRLRLRPLRFSDLFQAYRCVI